MSLKSYPRFSLAGLAYYIFARKIRLVSVLNLIDYDKKAAMDILQNKLDWVYYGGKHYESIYTRFYQSFYLPKKFNIDKRKAHYSNLVLSGQMTRDEALAAMQEPVYPENLIQEDYVYVTKKLGLKPEEMEDIIASPNKTFEDYRTSHWLFESAKQLVNTTRRHIG
jgi:hypothetical protein